MIDTISVRELQITVPKSKKWEKEEEDREEKYFYHRGRLGELGILVVICVTLMKDRCWNKTTIINFVTAYLLVIQFKH